MSNQRLDRTRLQEIAGSGCYEDYIPYYNRRDARHGGLRTTYPSPLFNRNHQFLSDGERYVFLNLLWSKGVDNVDDVQEQMPLLPIEETDRIADELGYTRVRRPGMRQGENLMPLTTDLLLWMEDGSMEAYAVKSTRKSLRDRDREKLDMERTYWTNREVPWKLVFKEDLDPVLTRNLVDLFAACTPKARYLDIDWVRHMIVHRLVEWNVSEPLDFDALRTELGRNKEWQRILADLKSKYTV